MGGYVRVVWCSLLFLLVFGKEQQPYGQSLLHLVGDVDAFKCIFVQVFHTIKMVALKLILLK